MSEPARGLKPWEPNELSPKHEQMVALSAAGLKGKEIAGMLGMSEARVSVILNDPRAKKLRRQLTGSLIRELAVETAEVIQSHTIEAVETLVGIMRHGDSDGVRLRAAENFLDRGGHPKVKEQIQQDKLPPLDDEKVELLRRAIQEATGGGEEVEMIEDTSGVFASKDDF